MIGFEQALVLMVESQYGFSTVDVGWTAEDFQLFEELDVAKEMKINWFSDVSLLQQHLPTYLERIGDNPPERVALVAQRIVQIATKVLATSNLRSKAWFALRSSLPHERSVCRRWHMDGSHFQTSDLQYKFCMTLKGDSTLFYLLPRSQEHLRRVFWNNMNCCPFTEEFCEGGPVMVPEQGEGVFFLLANSRLAAVHVEPEAKEPRLFFSIVPCEPDQLGQMEKRVKLYGRDGDIYLK